ncbi:MAG: hypothetical protein IKF37_00030 [Bacilli bacterium]|nr:hypothetical protein [Bacilli bacterium]
MTEEEYRKKKLELYKKIADNQSFSEEKVTNNLLCKKCGGSCCKNYPCSFSPDDFVDINDFNYMKQILDTGFFVIDSFIDYQNKKNTYFIRCRGSQDKKGIFNFNSPYGNECLLLYDTGCIFDFYTRPTAGALLIPKSNKHGMGVCTNEYTYKKQKEDWEKHQDIMLKLIEYYANNKKMPKVSKIYKLEKIIRQDEI